MGITREQFNEAIRYDTFEEHEDADTELVQHESTVMVPDAQIIAAIRAELTADENDEFADAKVLAKSQYYRQSNSLRDTARETSRELSEVAAQRKAARATAAAKKAAEDAAARAAEEEEEG